MGKCIDWGGEREKKCDQYRDEGYDDCKERRDEGYNDCDRWDQNCCDWWPCSMVCEIVSVLCGAWVWVTNIVCVVWIWVSNIVCIAWVWVTTGICVGADVVTAIIGAVLETLESILGWVLSAIAFVIEAILSVPILGRLLGWLLGLAQTIYLVAIGIFDSAAGLIGIRPEKKLRICTIILADESGTPIISAAAVVPWLQNAVRIFKQEANVRVLPVKPFQYSTGFNDDETVTEDWIHVRTHPSSSRILDLGGEMATAGADLIDIGSHYNTIANLECFYGSWRKLTGYGASITIFVIRSMEEGLGRSLGPLTDYVVIGGRQAIDITDVAHEMGHACYLLHDGDSGNLMLSGAPRGTSLSWLQTVIVRSSRHVTYF